MSTVFCFSMPLDLNVVVNHFTSLSIFVLNGEHRSIEDQVEREIKRMRSEYPQCNTELIQIKEETPHKFGNPRDRLSNEEYRVWVLSVQLYGVHKTIWFISGDPRKAYSVMYPNFFRKPVSVVLDDLNPKNSSIGVWEEYVEHSNNNAYWSEPMEIEVRSHQLIY